MLFELKHDEQDDEEEQWYMLLQCTANEVVTIDPNVGLTVADCSVQDPVSKDADDGKLGCSKVSLQHICPVAVLRSVRPAVPGRCSTDYTLPVSLRERIFTDFDNRMTHRVPTLARLKVSHTPCARGLTLSVSARIFRIPYVILHHGRQSLALSTAPCGT